ncbi:hypothetical protein Taro_023749 [Colocasia esculenta]|uniref:Uncharacterized protein n=1 Tax=Colocasia esculenta TaxID=4460 RepID=A0A843V990_COLES|nr:hypothetical protein [Colocasia esculenta]
MALTGTPFVALIGDVPSLSLNTSAYKRPRGFTSVLQPGPPDSVLVLHASVHYWRSSSLSPSVGLLGSGLCRDSENKYVFLSKSFTSSLKMTILKDKILNTGIIPLEKYT